MKVFLVQHSHSDPGYTHPRDEVWRHQLRNIELSVGFARRDPEYRWTVECFWMIDEARRRGQALPEGFLELARIGKIALAATYLNGSDHLDAEDLRRMLVPARSFCDLHHIPLRSAMQCDVNGVNACMPDLLNECGVTRMAFAINEERGGAPFRRPNAFWWRGPAGKRVLVYNGYEYLRANVYGMHCGFDEFCQGAKRLLQDLQSVEYGLPVCLLQGCGTYDDNGLATPWMAEMARAWRTAPRIKEVEFVSATIDEFFDALEGAGIQFPECTGVWPDWWSDGLASAPLELQRCRQTRRLLRSVEPLLPDSQRATGTTFDGVQRDTWMYFEHTFGSWRSVGEPEAPDSKRQWADKSRLAHRAAEEVAFLVEDVLSAVNPGDACLYFPPDCRGQQYVEVQVPREDFPQEGELLFEPNSARARAWVLVPDRSQTMSTLLVWADPAGTGMVGLRRSGFEPGVFESSHRMEGDVARAAGPFPEFILESLRGTREQLRHGDPGLSIRRERAVRTGVWAVESPLWSGARIDLRLAGWQDLSLTRRSWRHSSTHEYTIAGTKEHCDDPHASFLVWSPPARPDGILAESGGFWFRPGLEELPNACRDWHVVQQGVHMSWSDETELGLWSPDAAVTHFGGINTAKWGRALDTANGTVAMCLYHNYWYVNFPASAPGRLTYRIRIVTTWPGGPRIQIRDTLKSWNQPFLAHFDGVRARQLRQRRLSRLGALVID